MTARPPNAGAAAPGRPRTADLDAFERAVEHRWATGSGVRLHYAALGQGPLVVLLHGFPDHWLGWWRVMAGLHDGYRVVAPDLRGYNLSAQPEALADYAVGRLVDDLRAVIAAEGHERASVVGHDWGGFVAWHAAMDAPDCVERLAVVNMPHPWAIARELALNPAQRQASAYVSLFRQPGVEQQLTPERLSQWVRDPVYLLRQLQALRDSSLPGLLNYYRANWPPEPYAQRLDVPPPVRARTLLVHGLDDPYALPAGLNDVWAWVQAELTIHTLPGVGHFVQHERPAELVRLLRGWLAEPAAPIRGASGT